LHLALVHPCYNPHLGWEAELISYYKLLSERLPASLHISLTLVDDGSASGTEPAVIDKIAAQASDFRFIKCPKNRGKGAALREGMAASQADIYIYTDADYPYRLENILEMWEILAAGETDIVVGIRDDHYYEQLPFLRKVFSVSLRYMNYFFFPNLFVKDTQSGLKGFNNRGKSVFLQTRTNSFLFDLEFLRLASRRHDLRLKAILVHVREGISFSTMSRKTIWRELMSFGRIFYKKVPHKEPNR
jgi:glycosyltransferase involved in cell wall biosynthesis